MEILRFIRDIEALITVVFDCFYLLVMCLSKLHSVMVVAACSLNAF